MNEQHWGSEASGDAPTERQAAQLSTSSTRQEPAAQPHAEQHPEPPTQVVPVEPVTQAAPAAPVAPPAPPRWEPAPPTPQPQPYPGGSTDAYWRSPSGAEPASGSPAVSPAPGAEPTQAAGSPIPGAVFPGPGQPGGPGQAGGYGSAATGYGQAGGYGQPGGYGQSYGQYSQAGGYGQAGQAGQAGSYGAATGGNGSGRRWGVGVGIAFGAVLLSLCSGLVGGAVASRSGDSPRATSTKVTNVNVPTLDRKSVADVAAKVQPSVVDISTGQGEGSGIVFSADGAIVTNNHVVASAQSDTVTVTFSDGRSAKATIVGTDPSGDLAVIKAQGVANLTAAKFADSDAIRVGDTVLALGSPLGLQGSVTAGIVSALHRPIESKSGNGSGATAQTIGDVIQTDAAINPGNSGGALVDLAGEVVGMNTAIATSGQGEGNIGIGFAIPSNRVKSGAEQLLKGGKVTHPYVGVRLTDTDDDTGALIAAVDSGSPAEKAGVAKGDVITKAGGRTVTDANSLISAVQATKPGDQLQLTVTRNGQPQQLTVTVGER